MLSFFPRGVLDEILNLIESVTEEFPSYSITFKMSSKTPRGISNQAFRLSHNINVIRQTACMVVNPIKVNSFAYLFNCTTVGRTSD